MGLAAHVGHDTGLLLVDFDSCTVAYGVRVVTTPGTATNVTRTVAVGADALRHGHR